jgi:hypothetical protein
MNYKMKLSDLEEKDGMYYIADIVDLDGSPWVTKEYALHILDGVNEVVFEDFGEDLFEDEF